MKTPKMQAHKFKHALDKYGVDYEVLRPAKDKYGQPLLNPDGTPVYDEVVIPVRGIYSEQGTGFTFVIGDAATVHTKPIPTITTMYEQTPDIHVGDMVTVPPGGERVYKVVTVDDIGNLGLFAGISMEVVLDGRTSV